VLKALCDGKTSVEGVFILDRRNGRHELVQGLELSKGPSRNVEDTAVLLQHLFIIMERVVFSVREKKARMFNAPGFSKRRKLTVRPTPSSAAALEIGR